MPRSSERSRCPIALLTAVRGVTSRRVGWPRTADLVAEELRRHLPGPDVLTAAERQGAPGQYQCHLLHAELDGSFSVVAVVWRPGQETPVHDHVTWCVVGVLQGTEHEELFSLTEDGGALEEAGHVENRSGDVSGFAPPGDIHRVRNSGNEVAISLHVYGADISRLGTSVRRTYDLPVLTRA
jgi:predicted metal-dependent enzyme (double-stranded beta helix superfamily)